MDYLAIPPARQVEGRVDAPSSKSATNRALVLAALSPEPIEISRPLLAQDTIVLRRCLVAMGALIEESGGVLRVRGPLQRPRETETLLDAVESGTAARFLAAIAAVTPGRFRLTGAPRLRERPMGELVRALRSIGASIAFRDREGCLPLDIEGRRLAGGRVRVDASRSSQFVSALLLAAVATEQGLEVETEGEVASAAYIAMTVEALRAFGHDVSRGPGLRVSRGAGSPGHFEVPGDYSSALPLLAAAGVAGGRVVVERLAWPTADADAGALPALEEMGLSIDARPGAVSGERVAPLRGVCVRATDFPDAVPALAALACFAEGKSRFEGIGHLRLKESDRIGALVGLVTSAGGDAEAQAGTLIVRGPIARGDGGLRTLPTFHDHRIAMAGALLSLGIPGLLIEDPGCVAKSYPGFFRDLEKLVKR